MGGPEEFGGVAVGSVQSLILVQLSFSYANTPEHFPFLPCPHTRLYITQILYRLCVCVWASASGQDIEISGLLLSIY